MSKVLKNYFVIIFIAFVSFFTALNANNNPFRVGNTGTDSSVFNYVAQVIIDGGMPYRGVFVVIIPICMWLIKNGAFSDFIYDYFKFNSLYIRTAFKDKVNAFVYFMTQPVCIISILSPAFFCAIRLKNVTVDYLCLASVIISLIMISLSGQTYPHYGLILVPLFSYATGRFQAYYSEILHQKLKENSLPLLIAFLSGIILVFMHAFMWHIESGITSIKKEGVSKNDLRIAETIIDHTSNNDLITVCGNHDIIYLLSDRKSASVYSYQTPIAIVDNKIKENYIMDIKSKKPKAIIITDYVFYDEMIDILTSDYENIETVGGTEIYICRRRWKRSQAVRSRIAAA